MPQTVPNGWAEDSSLSNQLPNTPSGEVPIKSELTYKGEKYALITNSVGEYKVYRGGTGIFNQQIGESALIYSINPSGKIDNGPFGQALSSIRILAPAQKQTSEGLRKYLTSEEINKLQNSNLKASITNIQASPPEPTPGAEAGGGTTPRTQEEEEETVISGGFADATQDLTGYFDTLNFDKLKSFFQYPLDMDNNQDKITFSQYKYVATKLDGNINSIVNEFANRDSAFTKDTVDEQGNLKKALLATVVLPIPNQISETNQTGWGESNLTSIGALAMRGLSNTTRDLTAGEFINAQKQFGNTLKGILSGPVGTRAQSFLTAKIASQLISLAGINVDPEQFLTRASGGVINPNLELLFNGPKLRPFAFSFKMSPTSQDEARHIRAIIKFFKAGMAPQRSKKAQVNLYLGSPNVFKIEFKSRNNSLDGLPRIKTCALQSCAVNYAPDGVYAAYDDEYVQSQPVAVEIQLQFIELTPVFADEYDLENQNVPMGPDKLGKYEIESEPPTSTSTPQPGDSSPVADPAARGGVPVPGSQTNRRGGG